MNSIFSVDRKDRPAARSDDGQGRDFRRLVIIGASPFAAWVRAQTGSDAAAEFKRISEELSAARLGGGEENEAQMEKALAYLDSIAVSVLNVPAEPNLDGANRGWRASLPTRLRWERITVS